jgi:hypothetical protein
VPSTCQPMGLSDIAERLEMTQENVQILHHRNQLPKHRWIVSGRPCWNWPDVKQWARKTGRLREEGSLGLGLNQAHKAGKFDGQEQVCARCGERYTIDSYLAVAPGTLFVKRRGDGVVRRTDVVMISKGDIESGRYIMCQPS